ncbi:S-layer homology domain-containing protein [Alkalihalobacillus oceani]|uniref:S-layer homology domain-containing protein n=1 Tax=Halalkalibacter oceani TaxID=1653776 RepID=A0A9X2DUH4_9BACI|nr:S-layer homology domain-containing protein [Halalkalibacter oceani]MCM3715630.1 S-layer homology domain-containing protein [Halalkalibacter oceani]
MNKHSKAYRKYMATGIATAMVATIAAPVVSPLTVSADASQFSDVDENAWYYDNVNYLVDKGVLGGYTDGTLRPLGTLTRAEAAKMIADSLEIGTDANATLNFTDTKNGVWYTAPVAALVERGILNGFPDGSFRPNATVTRAEFAVMVKAAYMLEAEEGTGNNTTFPDVVAGSWYEGAVETLVNLGIVGGRTNGTFDPGATVLRAESAAFIHRTEVPSERIGYEEDEELSLGDVQVTTSNSGVTNVSVEVAGATAGLGATIEIFEDGATDEEAVYSESVPVEAGVAAADFSQLPLGNYVARVTVGEDEEALTAEAEFTVEALEIEEIVGTTTTVDAEAEEQFLTFSVNGEALPMAYLEDMGYEFEFLASNDDVVADARTGELDAASLQAGESFDYQVRVTGENDFELTSDVTTVSVESFATSIVSIDGADILFNDDVNSESGVISTSDDNISLADIAVEYRDGETTRLAADHVEGGERVFEFSSSDQTVALIDEDGVITPISDGDVTFTITAGGVDYEVEATVTSEEREATEAEVSKDEIGLVINGTDNFALTVRDQFGDAVKGFAESIEAVENSDEETILTAAYDPADGTDREGKVVVDVSADSANEGTGTLEIVNEAGDVLASLDVTVDADLEVASRSIELVNPSRDVEVDVNPFNADNNTLELVLNEYNESGLKIGGHNFNAEGRYTIESSNEDVLEVGGTPAADSTDGRFTVEAVAEGTATVQVKEGSIVRYETEVTVADTTPALAGASFVDGLDITSTEALAVEDIIDSLTFSGERGEAEVTYAVSDNNELVISLSDDNETVSVATISAFSVNVSDAGFYTDEDGDIFLGDAELESGFAAGTEGSIVLRLNRSGANNALITTVVTVDVN